MLDLENIPAMTSAREISGMNSDWVLVQANGIFSRPNVSLQR